MKSDRIAIVGIGLRYPDAATPDEIWENVLSGRRAFRKLPDERMNRADYYSPDPEAPDRFYTERAAVLRDFEFDRVQYKIAGSTYRSTDMTHWLALDVAARALADAGYPDGDGLPKQATSVVLGNSLTGEFSRANLMRLRWPYVRRTVAAALAGKGWDDEETATFLAELEVTYKAPFPAINEDTLAGGLANTIAGRICNHYDFGGGGYTVDGACASSLLSVVTAANALLEGDVEVAIAGGVDLSIDPFEVIGFAKTGALATGEMKIYDADSNGFWPGEGSGMLVLMREPDALARGTRIYASIAGWGVSSDGKGGITRPEADGHRLALTRAYGRAGYGVETVSYFEGHGTGTAVGDATEITALSTARRDAQPTADPAALGSIKGNIGHTKAAAGVAGLIKATLAVYHQVIPPATGHNVPHPLLLDDAAGVYVPSEATLWPTDQPVRAGVSAMGFGGINTHVALEKTDDAARRIDLDVRTRELVAGRQDAELILLDADDFAGLGHRVADLATVVSKLSIAEVTDLSAALAAQLTGAPVRAAIVVTDPADAQRKLTRLRTLIDGGSTSVFAANEGIFVDDRSAPPRIAYLFPGQGSGQGAVGAIRRRFSSAEDIFRVANLPSGGDQVATEVAQPRIVTGSLAALRVLREFGVDADTAVGHSLGELTALHWGGAIDERTLLQLARVRGSVMATASEGGGAMAGLATDPARVDQLITGHDVVIAGYNSPQQTVISGPAASVDRLCAIARSEGVSATRISVSHAFHSPSVEPAAVAMGQQLARIDFERLTRSVVSTVTGDVLHGAEDLRTLLQDQVVLPVRFREAAAQAVERADLVVEVGPGRVLAGLLTEIAPSTPVLPVDTDNASISPLLRVLGAAYALGVRIDTAALFAGRVARPCPLDGAMAFLASPCEAAPTIDADLARGAHDRDGDAEGSGTAHTSAIAALTDGATDASGGGNVTLDLLCTLAAERVELPIETIDADTHPLDDLHLSSITVGQLVNEVTRALGRPALEAMPNFATVCLGELAEMIDELAHTANGGADDEGEVPGVSPWVRPFVVTHVEARRPQVDFGGGVATADWQVFTSPGHPLADPLRDALASAGLGDGVLLCLPEDCDDQLGLFLDAGRAVLAAPTGTRFVVVQQGLGAAGFAKTVRLEDPSARTTIVELVDVGANDHETAGDSVARVVSEVAATTEFAEVRYDAAGRRTVPVLSAATPAPSAMTTPLAEGDVLLVTGGGKGITAECALAIATDSGATLALLGRSEPAGDSELAANLSRMDAAGVRFTYQRADVTSAAEVTAAIAAVEAEHGPVTAVLHGAGRNEPGALFSLTEEQFRKTVEPKVGGLRAVLAAVDHERIKLLITFGSIIGRAGLRGEAHYATANDWMTELTVRFGEEHPTARALALEWSVWSGAGMGERLGVVEALKRDGITPISTEAGIEVLRQVLADPTTGPVLVVCGRTSGLTTLPMRGQELPLMRFVDRALVHYPGVELITEADLSDGSDPYLADHELDGDLLFPAVLGMEAMTQVASAVTGESGPPLLENVEFLRPVIVQPGGSTTVRIAALVRDDESVDVVIRSSETGYSADHFRARLRLSRPDVPGEHGSGLFALPPVPVDPITELYGSVLFQGKRFQRLAAYRRASARHAVAEISTGVTSGEHAWFAPFLPQDRLLADPGTRDAMMHALQCCVPDATLLPQGVEKLYLADPADHESEQVVLDARERSQDGDSYVYDIDVRDPSGVVIERWEGLRLRAVRKRDGAGPWAPAMLGPYLERAAERVLGGSRAVVVEPDPVGRQVGATVDRRAQTELGIGRAVDRPVTVRYRPDGKPETDDFDVSASHGAGLTLVVAGSGQLSCDLESVIDRGEEAWAGLLGRELLAVRDLLVAETGEQEPVASTRVWCALECIRKAGELSEALTVEQAHHDGWVCFATGQARVATFVTTVNDRAHPVVFAVLGREEY